MRVNDRSTSGKRPSVWIVGSGRLNLRIPLMKALRERGFEMAAVGQDAQPEFQEHSFPYYQYPLRRAANPLLDRKAYRALCELFRRGQPQLAHAVNTKPCLLAPGAAKAVGVPACIRTITGLGALFSSGSPLALCLRPAYRALQRGAGKHSRLTVFQNPDDREYFLRHQLISAGSDRLVLSSGISVEEFRNTRGSDQHLETLRESLGLKGRIVVTMISRLIKAKGVEEFLVAAAQIRKNNPQIAFLLVGAPTADGPGAISVERVQRSSADVQYLGSRNDIASLLAISDIFALPSYFREGVPRVLLEAGAMSIPSITTNLPGCREVVHHEHTGLLIPPRSVEALVRAILTLVNRSELRRAMGRQSLLHVQEQFHLSKVADAYASIYEEAIRQSTPRALAVRRAA